MKSFINFTVIPPENGALTFEKELAELQEMLLAFQNEYQQAAELFQPFLTGAFLDQIHKSLINAHAGVHYRYQVVLSYLNEINILNNDLNQYLTNIHSPLIKAIIEKKVSLLHAVMLKMEETNPPLLAFQSELEFISKILEDLPPMMDETNINELQQSFVRLMTLLKKKLVQQKIDDSLLNYSIDSLMDYSNTVDFLHNVTPFKEKLESLLVEAESVSLSDGVDKIRVVLWQIELARVQCIKKQVDKKIADIQQNGWAPIEDKERLYLELTESIDGLLEVSAQLQLTESEKESYIDHLRAGYELTYDNRFLELILKSANSFFIHDQFKMQQTESYVHTSKSKIDERLAKQKRKHVHYENKEPGHIPVQEEEDRTHPASKRAKESENETESKTVQAFINILQPVIDPGKNLSRRFTASLLKSLAVSLGRMDRVTGNSKLLMNFDLLSEALKICPVDAKSLVAELNQMINSIKSNNPRMIRDYVHYSTNLDSNLPLQEQVKNILTDLVTEIDFNIRSDSLVNILDDSVDTAIEQLHKNWLSELREHGNITTEFMEILQRAYPKNLNENAVVPNGIESQPDRFFAIPDPIEHRTGVNSVLGNWSK